MRIADDLFLIALDDRTGELRVEHRQLSIGLAGALLSELFLASAVTVDGGHIRIRRGGVPPDSVTHAITELIVVEPSHPVEVWVRYVARDAIAQVSERLERQHVVQRSRSRSLRGVTVRFEPADRNQVAWRAVRLARLIDERAVTSTDDCVLALFARAIGLTRFILRDCDTDPTDYLDWLHQRLTTIQTPGLPDLLAAVTTATATHPVTHHR
jgi:hypothetical protein